MTYDCGASMKDLKETETYGKLAGSRKLARQEPNTLSLWTLSENEGDAFNRDAKKTSLGKSEEKFGCHGDSVHKRM